MDEREERQLRALGFMAVACLMGGVLVMRLAQLQIYEGGRFLKQAEGNRLRIIPQLAPRGVIRDRHGNVLASNRLSYSVALYPLKMKRAQVGEVIDRVATLLGVDALELRRRVEAFGYQSSHPIKLIPDIDQRAIARIAENQADLPGVSIEPDTVRSYPRGALAAHVLGYTGEVTEGDLTSHPERGMRRGDVIGKAGIERIQDPHLRGQNGFQRVEVDSRGRLVQTMGEIPAVPGKDLRLTLDADLQAVAEKALDEKKLTGAVVAMNPQTGEILAMASRPTFDPNIFSQKVRARDWLRLQRMNFPFVNRSMSAYPPGSIFKIPMALASLESGVCSPGRLFNSTGSLRVGNRVFHDWKSSGFGTVNLVKSLQWSIDTVYYQLGVEMGGTTMARYAREAGLGERTGVGLGGESPGLVPDPEWKQRVWHDKWWPGDSANMSIGQGAVSVTPLQAAVMISAIVNGGKVLVPRLVEDGKPHEVRKQSRWRPGNVAVVKQGIRAVVASGTGVVADVPGKGIAGKTGSAESGKPKTHAWFVCAGPEQAPSIAVVTFAEAAGHGGDVAAPVARKVLDQYFGLKEGTIRRATVID
ncbi:MAG: penicillin-binding protein 2 [Candidatus Sericytochromatia bacterium]|nr:penicillin-binding protein 2 [Candidatus Sericytochromatia bacterium]